MKSLRDILDNVQEMVIQAENYTWERLYSPDAVRAFVGSALSLTGSSVNIKHDGRFAPTGAYCQSLENVTEAVMLDDGRVLAMATTSEFAGTFASHDCIEVHYYGLTKKSAAQRRKEARQNQRKR